MKASKSSTLTPAAFAFSCNFFFPPKNVRQSTNCMKTSESSTLTPAAFAFSCNLFPNEEECVCVCVCVSACVGLCVCVCMYVCTYVRAWVYVSLSLSLSLSLALSLVACVSVRNCLCVCPQQAQPRTACRLLRRQHSLLPLSTPVFSPLKRPAVTQKRPISIHSPQCEASHELHAGL